MEEKKEILEEVSTQETTEPSNKKNKIEKENFKMFLYGLVGLVALVIFLTVGVGIYRVYAKTATDKFTYTVAKTLHLPAFKVGEEAIPYHTYVEDVNALKRLRAYEKKNAVAQATYANATDKQIRDEVLYRLADNALVKKSAKKYGIKVEDSDIASSKAQILQNFDTSAKAETEIKARFGWTLDQYVKKVAYPYNLRLKLSQKVSSDTDFAKSSYDEANKVLDLVKKGGDFAKLAKQYGNDGTASKGGDLGWFAKGAMVAEFEQAAFALKKGQLSDKLVKTQYGYHVVKLMDTRVTTSTDADGKVVKKDEIRASHIIFPISDINYFLDKMLAKVKIHWYLNVENPIETYLKNKNKA
jgi:hypothetical protein